MTRSEGKAPPRTKGQARTADSKKTPPSQAELLVQIVQTRSTLFHDAYEEAYLSVAIGDRRETMKLRTRRARSWLDREYFSTFGRVAPAQSRADALSLLEGLALHAGDARPVYVRTGEHDGRIYIDLGDDTCDVVEVSAGGWRIVKRAPVCFLRPKGMQPLPRPARGGSVEELREFINVKHEAHFRLLLAWIVAAQRPRGPYPILCIQGEHGSSKSTTTRLVRRLVDPNASAVRAVPRELRDLAIAGRGAHVLAFDNLSGIPLWLSDALCRVATGGGFATRALCTDDEEVIFDFQRPVIVNGIDDVATRPDLADRCLVVMLPAIPSAKRRREKDIVASFGNVAPRIYGAILSAVAGALAREDDVTLPELPRMADFAVFATAAEAALGWNEGDFMAVYAANRTESNSAALEADVVAQAVVRFMRERTQWSGTATELLDKLTPHASERDRERRVWPAAAHILSGRLRRAAPILRELGIDVDPDASDGRGPEKRRLVTLRSGPQPSVPSVPSAQALATAQDSGSARSDPASSPEHPSDTRERSVGRFDAHDADRTAQPNFPGGDAGDAGDASSPNANAGAPFAEWLESEGIA